MLTRITFKNLYVYFWRWATLKVFGSGWHDSTGEPDEDRYGIVCFITVAGFLNGPGFQKMREDLRRDSSEIWVIDCSPEGHQPEVPTRIFQGVQQPVCIVLSARASNKSREVPARLRYLALPKGKRNTKFVSLAKLSLAHSPWVDGATGWREPFLPEQTGAWASFPSLAELFLWSGPGVKTHRTWVISPDIATLENRWKALQRENDPVKKELLFHPDPGTGKARARYVGKTVTEELGSYATRPTNIESDKQPLVNPVRYAFRSFDRQWLPPDIRLLSRPRPDLWAHYSIRQMYLTALEASSPISGPAITLTGLIPDQDHYKGSFGGRIYPLWNDSAATQPNIKPALLTYLAKIYGQVVRAEDVMAYIAALMAQPAFIARFAPDLVRPGLHVPVTADANLFVEAVALGNEVVWLHCFGERFANPAAKRPKQAPRLPKESAPSVPVDGMIPSAPEPLPDTMDYDPATRRLKIGKGYIENVTPEMCLRSVRQEDSLAVVQLPTPRSKPARHRRKAFTVSAEQHTAGRLAARIHHRPARPAARSWSADPAGTGASGLAEPHLRRAVAERRGADRCRSICNARNGLADAEEQKQALSQG